MDSEKTQTTTEVKWYSCTRCGCVGPGMRYVGGGQWMCEHCYNDMHVSWEEAFERNEEEESNELELGQ